MKIGGLYKNSLIDYPGKISCVIFLSGCNFDCPYCHNPELARGVSLPTGYLSEDLIFDFLASHKGFLDGVVVSGGEPTIQKDIVSLCRKIKYLGYPIKIDTNGSRPEVIKKLICEDIVNYIAMDIKTDQSHYETLIKDNTTIDDISSSIRIIIDSNIDSEFRTTCIKSLVNESVLKNIGNKIKGSGLYALQQFSKTNVLHPEFFTDKSNIYSNDELMELKLIMSRYVDKCIIR